MRKLALAFLAFMAFATAAIGQQLNVGPLTTVGPITINPTTGTYNLGLIINQTGSSTASVPGAYYFNGIFPNFSQKVTGLGSPGATGCACVSGVQISMGVGGPNLSSLELYTLAVGMVHTANDTDTGDKVGISGGFYSNHTTPARMYGAASGGTVDTGGSVLAALGHEIDISITGTGVATHRVGFNIVNQGTGVATNNDTAIGVSGYPATGAFKTFVTFFSADSTSANVPFQTTADLFYSQYPLTIQNVFNLPNMTVNGNILNFPGVVLSGAGQFIGAEVNLYGAPTSVPSGHIAYGGTTAASSSCGSLSGAAGCLVINVSGTQHYVPYY